MKLNASRKTSVMANAYKKNLNFLLSKEPEKQCHPFPMCLFYVNNLIFLINMLMERSWLNCNIKHKREFCLC